MSNPSTSSDKKETFKWNTPADEFAEDVGSEEELSDFDQTEDGSQSTEVNVESETILPDRVADKSDSDEESKVILKMNYEETKANLIAQSHQIIESVEKEPKIKQKYPCPKCPKQWNWPWELRRHIVSHFKERERAETSVYKCKECGKGFQWKRDLAQHSRLHSGEKLLVCSVCEKKFTNRQALLHHVVVHTGEKPFQCALCGCKFTQPANLRTHMKKKHSEYTNKGNKCPHCSEIFPSVVSFHQHVLEDHQHIVAEERETQELERIKKETEKRRKEELKAERKRKRIELYGPDRARNKNAKEWELEYEFNLGDGLVKGVDWDRTPPNGELSCDKCDRKFGWRYEVMFHGLCHMVDSEGKPKNKVCPECDTAFRVPIGLKHHMLIHTGEKPFLCLHCWKSFASHIDLKLHIRKDHLVHLETKESSATARVKKELKKEISNSSSVILPSDQDMTLIVHSQDGLVEEQSNENTETIIINEEDIRSDQDMIVIVQSGEFEQSTSGLMLVDPIQIEELNGKIAVSQASEASDQFLSLESVSSDGSPIVLSSTTNVEHGNPYVVVTQDQLKTSGENTKLNAGPKTTSDTEKK